MNSRKIFKPPELSMSLKRMPKRLATLCSLFFLLSFCLLLPAFALDEEIEAPKDEVSIPAENHEGGEAASVDTAKNDIEPCTIIKVQDKPNDEGRAIEIFWEEKSKETGRILSYEILRSEELEGPFESITNLPFGTFKYTDRVPQNKKEYFYVIRTISERGTFDSAVSEPVFAKGQWFDLNYKSVLLMTIIYVSACLYFIITSMKGKDYYVRPIAGISAVDEAIGRATEMGKPILFLNGLGTATDPSTLASFAILSRVAKKTAEYKIRLINPHYEPIVMSVAQEVVKNAYTEAGHPDAYDEKNIFFITYDQFSFVAAVNGIMLRDKPATNFYMGMFYAESLILAETGSYAGSIQIAGTDQILQIPFFVTACDYTLIGEELYAASAYLSREPKLLGTLKGQDFGKLVAAIILVIGTIGVTLGHWLGIPWLNAIKHFFNTGQ